MFGLSSINYDLVLNKAITSSDNTVLIKLKAGDRRIGGIRFLLSWTQIDGLNLYTSLLMSKNKCRWKNKFMILNLKNKNNVVLYEFSEFK